MSIARGRIALARPIMIRQQLAAELVHEAGKGMLQTPALEPVALEPPYCPTSEAADFPDAPHGNMVAAEPVADARLLRRSRIWVGPEQEARWAVAEAFPRQVHGVRHRIGLEVLGNAHGVSLGLLYHVDDAPTVRTAFLSTFGESRLYPFRSEPVTSIPPAAWADVHLRDFHAPAAYSKRFTAPEELSVTPLGAVLEALAQIPWPGVGLYQLLFQPVAQMHNWHRNIAALHDSEFLYRLLANGQALFRAPQQLPSGDEKVLANSLGTRAHNDKAIFAVAVRVAAVGCGRHGGAAVEALAAFSGQIQQGGRPLRRLDESAYAFLDPYQMGRMFRLGLTYAPGFLANSAELTSLLHLPSPAVLKRRERLCPLLETLTPSEDLMAGSLIGDCRIGGADVPICIPLKRRCQSIHIIGKPGKGKSELLKRIILDDILRGDGLMLIDPHGDLVWDLLDLIPPEHAARTILLDWADPRFIPALNPLAAVAPELRGKIADDLVAAMKDLSEGWGHRAGHILHMLLYGLLHLPDVSLLDGSDALVTQDPRSALIRKRVLQVAQDPQLRRFWSTELPAYKLADRAPVQHKLGLLLDVPPVSRTFMQTDARLILRQAMAERKIILVSLAGLGAEIQSTLGSLLMSLLQIETFARDRKSRRVPFHLHIDEAHRFQTDALDRILAECRKFGIGVGLCHQYLRQYAPGQVDALSTVGNTIIFNVDTRDAQRLCDGLQSKVSAEDITALKPHEAIARLDTDIVRIHTRQVKAPSHPSCRQQIIDASHRLYYKTDAQVLAETTERDRRWGLPMPPPPTEEPAAGPAPDLTYDEF